MKTQDRNTNLCRVALALIFSFWFLIVGTPPAFCSAIPVDVLWAGMFDNSGQPLEGGKVYTYAAGTTATKTTYLDSSKLTAAANPVILDAYGRAQIYADGFYKFVIKTSDDVTLITIDNLEYTSSVSPTNLSVTNLTSTGATIGSITAMLGTLANMTISSATITLARLISPEIANASMTGSLYNVTSTNGTFTSPIITGGTMSPATFTMPTGASIATPTLSTQPVNKGYVDSVLRAFTGVYYFKADAYNATGATTLFMQTLSPQDGESAVTGMNLTLGNPTTATKTYIISGSFSVGAVSTDTHNLITMDFRDDSGYSYDTIYADIPNDVVDSMGFTRYNVQCHTVAYVQVSPGVSKSFYLCQQPNAFTTTYKVWGKTGMSDAFRIVGW